MREFMLARISGLALDMVHAVPSLFTVLLIFLIARFFIRLMRLFFKAVEQGTVEVPWLHPDTAQPTRRLVATLLWIFAAVMAYPYLPGSGTDAFKGASVFIGLVISLGSSGLVNQVMSSFMITYSRSLRLGDFVRVGEVEGTVNHVGVLSTKIKTHPRRGSHHPQRHRRRHDDHQLLTVCRYRWRLHPDERDHRLRHGLAAGAVAPPDGRGADARTCARRRRRSCVRSSSRTST